MEHGYQIEASTAQAVCDGTTAACCRPSRRQFILGAALAIAGMQNPRLAYAGPFVDADFALEIPSDKKLNAGWVRSLTERGTQAVYESSDLNLIGMPVGGICAGQLYLGGDGKLWLWDIFNQKRGTGDGGYAHTPKPVYPIEQGFAIRIADKIYPLDASGFHNISFAGQYPAATVEYSDPTLPLDIRLTAFSPFIPLNTDDSSLPATVMNFTIKNNSTAPVVFEAIGWLQNPAFSFTGNTPDVELVNSESSGSGAKFLTCGWKSTVNTSVSPARSDVPIEDFSGQNYGDWTIDGTAFGTAPARGASGVQTLSGEPFGKGLANSFNATDSSVGTLTSPEFIVQRNFIKFLIGGGNHPGETCVNLLVQGKVVRTMTGKNSDKLEMAGWTVDDLAGETARIQIVDSFTGGWGHIEIAQIIQSDSAADSVSPEKRHDAGTMTLAILGATGDESVDARVDPEQPALSAAQTPPTGPIGTTLVGRVVKPVDLAPGAEKTVTFLITWHYPNDEIEGGIQTTGRHYATKFEDSNAVAKYIASDYERLSHTTLLWRDTWYDSTLPYWFLDRTFANTSTLATSTAHRFADGRFWGWEGVGCCVGTCTHVYHYAQATARLFPDIERELRENVDLGLAFDPASGIMGFRAEFNRGLAVDGQAGTILRIYREHQMSNDAKFLKRNWAHTKKAFDPLFARDPNATGVLENDQMNTLDAPWFGKIAWTSSLYLAAVAAGRAMAIETGDQDFAARCQTIINNGASNLDEQLFNGEYYIQIADPAHANSVGSYEGCEIDQVFGESWARQVGLSRFLPADHVRTALQSLYKYNFTPDVGAFRAAHQPGRWFAMPGEGGLIMCTWPAGEAARQARAHGFDYYFNECMSGFEHQVAGHMIWEDMVIEGLTIERAIHDRYHPSRRNPYNEVECGDHYARAMASYGVYLAACGFEYHGPKGYMAFAPKINPGEFKAAFTSAEGWGSFSQRTAAGKFNASVEVKYGSLRLSNLVLAPPAAALKLRYRIAVGGEPLKGTNASVAEGKLSITFAEGTVVYPNSPLSIVGV